MIIKRLNASFGRLNNETLILKDGLNIIEAPNEAGKSTWCAFIRTMFYGIRTSDRDKLGYLSNKTRYRPWNGAPMEGSIEVETGNAFVTIQRVSNGKLPFKDFSAVYTDTGVPYEGIISETAGEKLFGVSEAVYERSAFISQSAVKIGQTPELEKRVSALVASGDESTSYSEADQRLRLWLRKRRFNKSGTLPALEEELSEISKKLTYIEAAREESASIRLEAEHLKKRYDEFSDELASFDSFEARQAYIRAQDKLAAAKADYDDVYTELTRNGPALTEKDIALIRGDIKALDSLKTMLVSEQKRLKNAMEHYAAILGLKTALSLGGTEAALAVDKAVTLEQDIKKAKAPAISIIAVVLMLIAVISGFAAIQIPAVLLTAAAAALICTAVLIWRGTWLLGSRKKLAGHLARYSVASVSALQKLYEDDLKLSRELSEAGSEVKATEKSVSSASSMYDSINQNLYGRLETYFSSPDLDSIEGELSRLEALLGKLAGGKADIQGAESFLRTMIESVSFNHDEEQTELKPPARRRAEIVSDVSSITVRLEELTNRYNMTLGEIRALGDPAILGSQKKTAESDLQTQRIQYEALCLAIETLNDANNELQTRFSPLLSETAGRIITRLTAGRYEKLTFDKALDAAARSSGETVSRGALSLSTGTADQIYLALRLAVVELILPKADPCPLILDDALSNFDDARVMLALDYLSELALKRQILLFTCHARESAYFSGNNKVNLIKLK